MDPRLSRALASLEGLSVGDAFGERFFGPDGLERAQARAVPPAPWGHTDDTQMGMAVVEVLAAHGGMDPDALAARFAARYRADPTRGYGRGAHELLGALCRGVPWWQAAPALFGGGSFGNGGAMRAGPVGAFFADDLDAAVEAARASAAVTHAHDEGKAGAIAVAVAAACACARASGGSLELWTEVLARTPPGRTHDGLLRARDLADDTSIARAAALLGNGGEVVAWDTVPLALWIAARCLRAGGYEEALWQLAAARGDIDTTCAIAGSVVGLVDPPPEAWRAAREPLDLELPRRR